jgi:hypothetical protein
MTAFQYSDGVAVQVGDRVRLEDGRWNGIVEELVDSKGAAEGWGADRGVLVRFDEVGLPVFYPDEIEPDIVLVARRSAP